MREDIVQFMDHHPRPVTDWKADMRTWARLLDESASNLEAFRPGQVDELRAAATELLNTLSAPHLSGEDFPRARVARLCSYLHASASLLAEYQIVPHELEAMDAAREVACAAIRMLAAMEGDYGEPVDETFA